MKIQMQKVNEGVSNHYAINQTPLRFAGYGDRWPDLAALKHNAGANMNPFSIAQKRSDWPTNGIILADARYVFFTIKTTLEEI